jgi:hypothetical protein
LHIGEKKKSPPRVQLGGEVCESAFGFFFPFSPQFGECGEAFSIGRDADYYLQSGDDGRTILLSPDKGRGLKND